jgi:asparagine N-glycosylation enzyme membrane subunit Stt3
LSEKYLFKIIIGIICLCITTFFLSFLFLKNSPVGLYFYYMTDFYVLDAQTLLVILGFLLAGLVLLSWGLIDRKITTTTIPASKPARLLIAVGVVFCYLSAMAALASILTYEAGVTTLAHAKKLCPTPISPCPPSLSLFIDDFREFRIIAIYGAVFGCIGIGAFVLNWKYRAPFVR